MTIRKEYWLEKPEVEQEALETGSLERKDIQVNRSREVIRAVPTVRVKPALPSLLNSAYAVVERELKGLQDRVESGETLDKDDVTKLHKLVDSLTRLGREEREQEKRDDPGKIPLHELLEQAEEALSIFKDTKGT